jgi:hypothetical protein
MLLFAKCSNREHKESRKTGKEKAFLPGFLHSLFSPRYGNKAKELPHGKLKRGIGEFP